MNHQSNSFLSPPIVGCWFYALAQAGAFFYSAIELKKFWLKAAYNTKQQFTTSNK